MFYIRRGELNQRTRFGIVQEEITIVVPKANEMKMEHLKKSLAK